jgi:DNA-directed RNA polymerase specialized sigma24 family protein
MLRMVMTKSTSPRRVPEEKAASAEEVRAAIDGLSEAQLVRFKRYAERKIKGLGRRSLGRDHMDLLQEAITSTLAGDRHWNKTVDFSQHLFGAMSSIANNWAKKADTVETRLESELIHQNAQGSPEQQVSVKQQFEEIAKLLAGDQVALDVFGGLRAEMTGADVQEALGISKREYETTVKRIYRRARAILQ